MTTEEKYKHLASKVYEWSLLMELFREKGNSFQKQLAEEMKAEALCMEKDDSFLQEEYRKAQKGKLHKEYDVEVRFYRTFKDKDSILPSLREEMKNILCTEEWNKDFDVIIREYDVGEGLSFTPRLKPGA